MAENETEGLTSISHARTIEEIGEFWDSHDLTDFEDQTHAVEIEVRLPHRRRVALAPALAGRLEQRARRDGVSVETLVNLWVAERLQSDG